MSADHPQRRLRLIAVLATVTTLGLAGLTACGSDPAAEPTPAPESTVPESTVLVKNGVMRTTTTKVPSTIQVPHGGSGGKPKRP